MKTKYYRNRFGGFGIVEGDSTMTGDAVDLACCRTEKQAQELVTKLNSHDDLLAACLRVANDPYTTCQCAEVVRAAIAKATGNAIPQPAVSENLNQPLGIEDSDSICPKTGKRHVPDWPSVSVQWDGGEAYIDANCRDCGRSGCIGTSESLSSMVNW